MDFSDLMFFCVFMTIFSPITYCVLGGGIVLYVFRPVETLKVAKFLGWGLIYLVGIAYCWMVVNPFILSWFN